MDDNSGTAWHGDNGSMVPQHGELDGWWVGHKRPSSTEKQKALKEPPFHECTATTPWPLVAHVSFGVNVLTTWGRKPTKQDVGVAGKGLCGECRGFAMGIAWVPLFGG